MTKDLEPLIYEKTDKACPFCGNAPVIYNDHENVPLCECSSDKCIMHMLVDNYAGSGKTSSPVTREEWNRRPGEQRLNTNLSYISAGGNQCRLTL